ncbi:DEAD/DEAH box helicase [Muricomes intestini]|uniref:DEAD/DEAH box helicase n=1 Tax=Muricomes intestini TaxID=1796634 RepID=UPI002FE0C439
MTKELQSTNAQLQFIFTDTGFYAETSTFSLSESDRRWKAAFDLDCYNALFQFSFEAKSASFSPSAAFLYLASETFFKELTSLPELELARETVQVPFSDDNKQLLLDSVPFSIGAEYITEEWLKNVFGHLQRVFASEISGYKGSVSMYLAEKSQHLQVPERIFFHLVESHNSDYPFAFLATYATRTAQGSISHMPLEYALTEYKNEREKLLALLSCLNKAAEVCELISGFVESGELFHPLRLTASEAYAFLKAIPDIEKSGILCRIPNWWKKKSSSISLSVSLGDEKPSMLGFDTLVSIKPSLTIDGTQLSAEDIQLLLNQTNGLAFIKGKWIEVNHALLEQLLKEIEDLQEAVPLLDALRLDIRPQDQKDIFSAPEVTNGAWLKGLLQNLRSPGRIKAPALPKSFTASLRHYQKTGYTWLNYMSSLGFGACLADDMGLGKTVQVLAYLESLRQKSPSSHVLLIVPASLLGNWEKETLRFVPNMSFCILHGKSAPALSKVLDEKNAFLYITTYGMASRIKTLSETNWQCIILDEAQAIKNPATKQTKNIKKLHSDMRIAMTGTPIENDLSNLWSLFDFLNHGLLGTPTEFKDFSKSLDTHPEGYQKLKTMVSPFILRRLKTDKRVIADLPDKLETIDYSGLSKKQIVLYRKFISDLEHKLSNSEEGMERRGLILSSIVKLKQICNHPDQYLGGGTYLPEESGKFQMLRDICETIFEKRERVLVFTQFKEITKYLAGFLEDIFHNKGYIIDGGTRIKKRTEMVDAFNGEQYVPFMILSVKAGGTGLNLTSANHVIHFDRWWNPAVENQATDRAYRIGQTKNVIVHKLVCEGTIEEKINALINSKKELAENVIGSGGEKWITELNNEELLSLMRLE